MKMNYLIAVVLLTSEWTARARILTLPRQPRLSLAEPSPSYYHTNINGQPGTYAFGYDVSDPESGNTQFRNEERYPNGTVTGSYGYLDAAGRPVHYRYVADGRGYRVFRVNNQIGYPSPIAPNSPFQSGNLDESTVTWSRRKNSGQSQNVFKKSTYLHQNDLYKHQIKYET